MAGGWNCSRCSTPNDDSSVVCAGCGLIRGSVAIPAALDAPASGAVAPGAPGPSPAGPTVAPTQEPTIPGASAPAGPVPAMEDWTPRELAAAEPTAAPLPLWRRLPIGWLVFGALVLGGGATSWFFGASRSDSGEIAKTGDMNAVDLRVGDCFDFKDPNAEELEDVTAMPCAQEHEHELIFTGSMPAGAYPADAAFDEFVTANCDPAFKVYIGMAYEASTLEINWLAPTADAWRDGDRSIQCAVSDPQATRRTGSLKGSDQ